MRRISITIIIVIVGLTYGGQNKRTTKVEQGFNLANEQIAADLTIPQSINFQGYLYQAGNPVTDTMNMWFGIYDASSGGSLLYQITINNVEVIQGYFNAILTSIPSTVFPTGGPIRYLEIKAPSNQSALTPRTQLVSVGYGYHSLTSDTAEYAKAASISRPITPPIYSTEIRDTTIITAKIKDAMVTNPKLADNSVSTSKIQDGAITTSKIADGNITMPKINQSSATAGQVIKWTGSAWAPRNDSIGGGSGVTSVSQSTGITCSPNPITTTGSVSFDQTWGDGRYVNTTGATMTGNLVMMGSRVDIKKSSGEASGRIYSDNTYDYWILYSSSDDLYFDSNAHTGTDWIMNIDYYSGDVTCNYDFYCNGTKYFVEDHPTDLNKEIIYACLEGSEVGTYYRGSAQLINGEAIVLLPEHFGFVTTENNLTAQVTPRGNCNGLYVEFVSTQKLVVKELQGGKSNVQFDYLIQGIRKGYENHDVIRDKKHRVKKGLVSER
jgi:hypothetical protein